MVDKIKPYHYQYFIELRLADNSLRKDESLENYAVTLHEAEKYFNQKSRLSTIKKEMQITDIKKETISVTLSSSTILTTPTLALQAFSRYIVNNKTTEHLVKNKALFRGEFKEIKQDEEMMTDVELLKELIDIVVSGRKEQKQVLEEIKLVLKNSKN